MNLNTLSLPTKARLTKLSSMENYQVVKLQKGKVLNFWPSAATVTGTICIGSNFWKFYLIRTGFTLCELVSSVKVFKLFRSEQLVLVFRVWTRLVDVQHLIYWQGQLVWNALFTRLILYPSACSPSALQRSLRIWSVWTIIQKLHVSLGCSRRWRF